MYIFQGFSKGGAKPTHSFFKITQIILRERAFLSSFYLLHSLRWEFYVLVIL